MSKFGTMKNVLILLMVIACFASCKTKPNYADKQVFEDSLKVRLANILKSDYLNDPESYRLNKLEYIDTYHTYQGKNLPDSLTMKAYVYSISSKNGFGAMVRGDYLVTALSINCEVLSIDDYVDERFKPIYSRMKKYGLEQ